MEDTGQRKIPPDQPSDSDGEGRKKKKKMEEIQTAIMDDNMNEVTEEGRDLTEKTMEPSQEDDPGPEKEKRNHIPAPSYKQSLLGFNGVPFSEVDDVLIDSETSTVTLSILKMCRVNFRIYS